MLRIIERYISRICVVLCAGTLLSLWSCSSSADSELAQPDAKCIMELYVDLGNKELQSSRANPPMGSGYDPGSGFENKIDPNDLMIFLFSTDNKLIAPIYGHNITPVDNFSLTNLGLSGGSIYRMSFRVDKILEDVYEKPQSFKIVMLANWQRSYPLAQELVPGTTTIQNITEHLTAAVGTLKTAAASAEGKMTTLPLSDDNLIPFYGVQEYKDIVFTPGGRIISDESIMLLRAFAKIDICDHAETTQNIKSVTLRRYNTRYYKAPLGIYHNNDYTNYDYATDYIADPSIPSEGESDGEIELVKGTDGHFVAYLPEYKNIGRADNEKSRLVVAYDDGYEFVIDFKHYNNPPTGSSIGAPYDIRRNNWYKFTVKRKLSEITLTADVIPFTPVELTPDYGLEREDITGYVVGKDNQGRPCWYGGFYDDAGNPIPLYLGPDSRKEGELKDATHGKPVEINDTLYVLVYTNYERTVANLDHIFEAETRKIHLLYEAGRTGYENVNWTYYLNKLGQRVWLDESLRLKCYRTLNEWDRQEYSIVNDNWPGYDHKTINPRFWFDVLGHRYPWSEGDTKAKRAKKIGGWTEYLEDPTPTP